MSFTVLSHGIPAVARGQLIMFSAFDDNGPMWTGKGAREERRRVSFGAPFLEPPMVHAALTMWDISDGANQRAQLVTEEVDVSGFTAVFRTWGDTRVARVSVTWMAIGVAHDPELWQL